MIVRTAGQQDVEIDTGLAFVVDFDAIGYATVETIGDHNATNGLHDQLEIESVRVEITGVMVKGENETDITHLLPIDYLRTLEGRCLEYAQERIAEEAT